MPLLKQGEKKLVIVVMSFPKMGGKKNWNGIVAMVLPKQVKFFFVNCGNVIAENGREKKMWLPKSGKELKKKVLRSQYFYNIFTTNYR